MAVRLWLAILRLHVLSLAKFSLVDDYIPTAMLLPCSGLTGLDALENLLGELFQLHIRHIFSFNTPDQMMIRE